MRQTLLVLDIDDTLADGYDLPSFADDPEAWRAAVETTDLPPIAGAVAELAKVSHKQERIFVTARPVSLFLATRTWLSRHFPALVMHGATLVMRAADDERPGWCVKADAIALHRGSRRVVLVDDDSDSHLALDVGDDWLHPRDWHLLCDVLGGSL